MAIICQLLNLYILILFVRIAASWFPIDPDSGVAAVIRTLDLVVEPVLGPLRRSLPPVRMGAMALDLSPILLLIGIQVLQQIIGC